MGLFSKLFKSNKTLYIEPKQVVTNDEGLEIIFPDRRVQSIGWNEIQVISIVTTDKGPFGPDVWLTLTGKTEKRMIPQSIDGYELVHDIVSKYPGFDLENVIAAAQCTDNREFVLWRRGT